MSSILNDIKDQLGGEIDHSDTDFDTALIIAINTAFARLATAAIKSLEGFRITSSSDTWDSLGLEDDTGLEMIKIYVYLRTKLLFDPPQSSYFVESMKEQINEFEFCLRDIYDICAE